MAPSCPRVPLLTCPSSCWATMIASSGIPITFARSDLRRRNQVPSSMCLLVLAPELHWPEVCFVGAEDRDLEAGAILRGATRSR